VGQPIFTFLIQFEFYPTKWLRFEKISPPMFLEFDLVFLHNFPIFSIFLNINSKNRRFLNLDLADPAKFRRFSEKSADFLNPANLYPHNTNQRRGWQNQLAPPAIQQHWQICSGSLQFPPPTPTTP
jgi:hypothetical protein